MISSGGSPKSTRAEDILEPRRWRVPMILTRAQRFWGRTWNEEPPLPKSECPEAAP